MGTESTGKIKETKTPSMKRVGEKVTRGFKTGTARTVSRAAIVPKRFSTRT